MYYLNEYPFLLETKYGIDSVTKNRMIATILNQKDSANYYGGYTFKVEDTEERDFQKLYNFFFKACQNLFGDLILSPRHKSWCWANVYNCDTFKTNLHNHKTTSSINAVYYLHVPTDIQSHEGGIRFVSKNNDITFFPDDDDLIIMPCDLDHEPLYHSSKTFRIAINMEITTENSFKEYYTLDRISKNALPKL